MIKWLAILLLTVSPALAQGVNPYGPTWPYGPPFTPCPYFQAGWAITFTGNPITAVMYDQSTSLLYVIFNNNFPSAYWPVPVSIVQTFSQSRNNPMQIYQTYVVPRYEALLLEEIYNCPILREPSGAYIWTN